MPEYSIEFAEPVQIKGDVEYILEETKKYLIALKGDKNTGDIVLNAIAYRL